MKSLDSEMKNENGLGVELDQQVVDAWKKAADDLEIRITAPFVLIRENGEEEIYEALVHDFGGPKGMVTGKIDRYGLYKGDPVESRRRAGYAVSNLSDSYRKYDRKLFQETLDDWQWYGNPDQRPSWYTGKPWA
ncbi:MAG TPA: hypothetical protein VHA06_06115 [Candidatus Angelobacter sp.]|jgi:hypothetical protein|nr:hypothetical protein [Candidatus Angelobacter sp.]